ncbi:Transcription factor [Ranunculus cassubicifolius]
MKILHDNNNSSSSSPKQKERHIVTWTQQEDDTLREQISIHGTENWAIIAAQFKDKTTRQCRRRWYTYLNSDFKKGGWTQEEDMILCEAQKVYGNRWTEIAKVVSGRTDNAVKNRFSTLCKKRAKHEALAKENNLSSCILQNNKRAIIEDAIITSATSESAPPLKKMRTHIVDITENFNLKDRLHIKSGTTDNQPQRIPLTVLPQNSHDVKDITAQQNLNNTSVASNDGDSKAHGTYLKRDDPRIHALMEQAELLSSLAVKVNTEKNNQSLENAWKELQDFLQKNNENEPLSCQISESDFPFEELMNLLEENSNMGSLPSWRQPNLHESPESSGYSTGSTRHPHIDDERKEEPQAEISSLQQDSSTEPQSIIFVENEGGVCGEGFTESSEINVLPQTNHPEEGSVRDVDAWLDGLHIGESVAEEVDIPSSEDYKENEVISGLLDIEFTSPVQATPLFNTFTAAIPSPQFSESERHFLMKTLLGSPNPTHNPSKPPPCRRALLHSL